MFVPFMFLTQNKRHLLLSLPPLELKATTAAALRWRGGRRRGGSPGEREGELQMGAYKDAPANTVIEPVNVGVRTCHAGLS